MSKRKTKIFGTCALCGRNNVQLSYEHIPPKSTYNNSKVRVVVDENEIWDKGLTNTSMSEIFKKVKWKEYQAGYGKYCLCKECNSYTGGNYGKSYKDFVDKLVEELKRNEFKKTNNIVLKNIYPLRVIKQILSLFCDISIGNTLDSIKPMILDKYLNVDVSDEEHFNFRVYAYLLSENVIITNGITGFADIYNNYVGLYSSIMSSPISYTLYHQNPRKKDTFGTDITFFLNYGYDDCDTITLTTQVLK